MRDIRARQYTSAEDDRILDNLIPAMWLAFFLPLMDKVAQAAYEDGFETAKLFYEDMA